MSKDPFEKYRCIQKFIDKPYLKTIKQFEEMNRPLLQMARHQELLRSSFSSLIEEIRNSRSMLSSALSEISKQTSLFQEVVSKSLNQVFLDMNMELKNIGVIDIKQREEFISSAQNISSTLGKIAKSSILNAAIPDEVYLQLKELTSTFHNTYELEEDDSSDTVDPDFEQNPSKEESNDKKVTWYELLYHLLFIFSVLYPPFIDYVNKEQHKEQMNELKKQTEVQEQLLEVSKQQLEKQVELEQKLDQFLEFIRPLIPEDVDDPESDSGPDQ